MDNHILKQLLYANDKKAIACVGAVAFVANFFTVIA